MSIAAFRTLTAGTQIHIAANGLGPGGIEIGAEFGANFFQIEGLDTACALAGTVTNDGSADIQLGGSTIILTLIDTEWAAAGATFDAQRQAIINGIDSAQAEAGGWDAKVKTTIPVANVVRTSATVVTITLPAVGDYAITGNETVTAIVPNAALVGGGPLTCSPTFTITSSAYFASGTAFSPLLNVGAITNAEFSTITWGDTTPAGTTVAVAVSFDQITWTNAVTGAPIPIIADGANLTGKTLYVRVTLTTTVVTSTPEVDYLYVAIEDAAGLGLFYELTTSPGVTIDDSSTNSNIGIMSYPVGNQYIVTTLGGVDSVRDLITPEEGVGGVAFAPPVAVGNTADLFCSGAFGTTLPFAGLVTAVSNAADLPARFIWVLIFIPIIIVSGAGALWATQSLLVSAIVMGAVLSLLAILGTCLLPMWMLLVFVIIAAGLLVMRPRVPGL